MKSFLIFCTQFIFLVKFNRLPKFNAPEGQSQTISINQIKPKKQNDTPQPPRSSSSHGFGFFGFLLLFWFSRGFSAKIIKNLEKTKKINKKKQQNDTPQPPRSSPSHGFGFFGSRGFSAKVPKTSRTPKKQKKNKLQTLTHQLVPTWVLQFWFLFASLHDVRPCARWWL